MEAAGLERGWRMLGKSSLDRMSMSFRKDVSDVPGSAIGSRSHDCVPSIRNSIV